MKENIQAFMVELVRGMILLACIHMVEMMILVIYNYAKVDYENHMDPK